MVGEESEDEALEGEEDTKKSEYAGSTHNDNSVSPPPPMQAITGSAPPQAATGLTVPSSGHAKKRHRSQDSEDVEEVNVSSPKKSHNSSHRPLGLPGANIKIENRGTYFLFAFFDFNDIQFTFDQIFIEIYLFHYNSKAIKLCSSFFSCVIKV